MSELDVSNLLSVQQAIRILDAVVLAPRTIKVPLAEAEGLRLAVSLSADRDFPPFDKSQMDGYAVRLADVTTLPTELNVVGEIAAGRPTDHPVGAGETMSIMTGAPMPQGANGVIPVEDVEKLSPESVRVLRAENPTRHIAPRGSDCPAGLVVLRQGVRLGPAQLAVAASIGAAEIEVFARPRVAVLTTGDELVPVDQQPQPHQIRNSNGPMLLALLRRLGCQVTDLGTIPDDARGIREAIARGLEADALFIAGGLSMGEHDYVPRVLKDLGVEFKITKLRIKPGKPFLFGTFEADARMRDHRNAENEPAQAPVSTVSVPASPRLRVPASSPAVPASSSPVPVSHLVFGLPGNPVSAFVCTMRLASRVLARLAGGTIEERWVSGKLDTGLPVNGPREFYQPAIRTVAPGRDSSHAEFATITPLKWKSSADLFTLARANVLLVRPENDPPLGRGTVLRCLEF